MASGSNNTTKTTAASASLDPGANVYDIYDDDDNDDDEEECEEVAVTGTGSNKTQTTKKPRVKGPMDMLSSSEEIDDLINEQLTKYQNAEGVFGLPAAIRQRSRKSPDKGKLALYDEDEIEEDLGLTDVEEDDRVPGYDD
ncbi:hypothetical protein E3N88_14187 [Mikania micrantha]|uniref:Uncharacterized protein n=1 Tax=Mikania micrantha TaxID=192012 RepID=A0A5N6P225_9ASTR|nr:hypothetical protein E3N88_14187 [Mikania micrantha]